MELLLMFAEISAHLITQVGQTVLASTEDEGGSEFLLLAGPVAGGAIYAALYRYYRNTDKSHAFEHETLIESQPITGGEEKIDEVRGTKRSSIQGNNVNRYRERVHRVLPPNPNSE